MNVVRKSFQYGKHTVTLETGRIARQATSSVLVNMDDTVVLVTVVGIYDEEVGERDFFPLTVNYQEKNYAAGAIPGGYFKREGRPTEKETLTSRLIDRPLRPLFPDGFSNEVQVVATVLSMNPEVDGDIPALIGSSAALFISGIPFNGPLGAARVSYKDGQYLLNPTFTELQESDLDLVVAGTRNALLMVESEAKELSEEIMLNAVLFGHQQMQIVIDAIEEFGQDVRKPKWDWSPAETDHKLQDKINDFVLSDLRNAYQIQEKVIRKSRINELFDNTVDHVCAGVNPETDPSITSIEKIFSNLEKKVVRDRILSHEPRIDGRDHKTIRPITVEVGVLPRTHGSAMFTRGETQALVITTLGTGKDAQTIDALEGERKETFMLHYNFPPYCVGEVGFVGAPKRREIGHGRLAKRAIQAVIPTQADFPYVIRSVSEIMESNGSSSMASVCGTSLALMDAGVPIKAPVAGIAMGLVKEDDRFVVLSDILGDEDHLGDMDFKVAGTTSGVTALQMDIKIQGITKEIIEIALQQAKEGRLHILSVMNQVISEPRQKMSDYAPRIVMIQIKPDKIGDVIGKGGSTIRGIIEETGATIDIDDKGLVKVAAVSGESAQKAIQEIERLTAEVEVGKVYLGTVTRLMDFGAFVNVMPGQDGLLHISQICDERLNHVSEKLSEGQKLNVKVLEVDRQGRIRLSMKQIEQTLEEESSKENSQRTDTTDA